MPRKLTTLSHLAALVESSGDAIFEETTEGVVVF
jgi:hypothetical protein